MSGLLSIFHRSEHKTDALMEKVRAGQDENNRAANRLEQLIKRATDDASHIVTMSVSNSRR
jgi:outer membrane murein-binding lipoprotein Lpp